MKEITNLDEIIIGRVEPHIYAFTTNTIPNYLKVGDTYRPVSVRLKEWQELYPTLQKQYEKSASINDDVYFRDYSIHQFLENELKKERLTQNQINKGIYYSNEFFKDTSVIDIDSAIDDIKSSYEKNIEKYTLYNSTNLRPITTYQRSDEVWNPRPNQEKVIENFKEAIKAGRTNLLMYAVMRFGKSFTSMCCAEAMRETKLGEAKIIVVVSAKADVQEEWRRTVQIPKNFENYEFLTSTDLVYDNDIISKKVNSNKKVVLFLTLQDLQGITIKEKHKKLFSEKIDLLLIDETHFGARADKYGEVLRERGQEKDKADNREDSVVSYEEAYKEIKTLCSKVRIHLSGTPYRILMGSEFAKNDIIAFCQFTDIVNEKDKWDRLHIDEDEWKNPYYGFPQMIRFAFNPNESVRKKLEEFKESGITYSFSELFKPRSIKKNNKKEHKIFKYEKEVLDLLEIIDGSKRDENILGFLDYENIKKGKMCRHIVIVLPYCASCDAMENLIQKNKFKNLNEYQIINISGVDNSNIYKKVSDVKEAIKKYELENKKTITLTVNRMLTGSTVPEWDTMIYLKDTSSPQEYDQATFRLQNQYIRNCVSEDGSIIKLNKKPQTLLVDFDPNRMFIMQELKSKIYDVNVDKAGNSKLQRRLDEELKISPIITLNSNKIKQIDSIDIMNAVSKYSSERGVYEETNDIPIDMSLLLDTNIAKLINSQGIFGTKKGLELYNTEDSEQDSFDFGEIEEIIDDSNKPSNITKEEEKELNTMRDILSKKWRTYYARILFFSMLTKDNVISLEDIISKIDNKNNDRISKNLDLNKKDLKIIFDKMDKFILSQLDYKIQNINRLINDEKLNKLERAQIAINKFDKLSESEIITPQKVCNKLIACLGVDRIKSILENKHRILDIASKEAEFLIAIYNVAVDDGFDISKCSDLIYSIPTSKITYEFTRKIYELLGFNVENIACKFNTFDLLKVKTNGQIDNAKLIDYMSQNKKFSEIELDNNIFYEKGEERMTFDLVVGNPPYQEESKTENANNGQNSRTNIFQHFQSQAYALTNQYTALIYPGIRWIHQSGKGLKKFGLELINSKSLEKLYFYPNVQELFENVGFGDGISMVLLNKNKKTSGFEYNYIVGNNEEKLLLDNPGKELLSINPKDTKILNKIKIFIEKYNLVYLHDGIFSRSLFNIDSNMISINKNNIYKYDGKEKLDYNKYVKLLTNDKPGPAGRTIWFVAPKNIITKNQKYIDEWQVVVSSAHPGGQDGRDNQLSIVDNHSAFGRARVALKSFKTEKEAINFYKYISSKFIKYTFLLTDEALSSLAKFVPDLIDYKGNEIINFNKDIDSQLYSLLDLSQEEIEYIENMVK